VFFCALSIKDIKVMFCFAEVQKIPPKKQAGLEDHPRICKWLVTSIYKPFGRGTTAVGVVTLLIGVIISVSHL